jgi:hypothetical protein
MRNLPPIVYASVVGLLLACSDSTAPSGPSVVSPPNDPPRAALDVSPSAVTLQPGQTYRFTVRYGGDPALMGTPGHVAWQSSDNNVASVTGGVVSALGAGQATITAFWGGYQASALVNVVGPAKKHEDAIACLSRLPQADERLMRQCR